MRSPLTDLGFSGGGLDTIRLADCATGFCDQNTVVADGHIQGLKLESIELQDNNVPEPATLGLLGLAGLGFARRRQA